MRNAENIKLRATYAALCAVGSVIPHRGIEVSELRRALAPHLDEETLEGLVRELGRRKIVSIPLKDPAILVRGSEYMEGLERLRLACDSLRE